MAYCDGPAAGSRLHTRRQTRDARRYAMSSRIVLSTSAVHAHTTQKPLSV